jgi:nucleotide-binding universal stress UspA family protein
MDHPFASDPDQRALVLVGSSLGPESDAVVGAALRLARALAGRLYVVHALESPPLPGSGVAFSLAAPELATRAREKLQQQLDRIGASAGEVAGLEARAGSSGGVLSAAASLLGADAVVVAASAAAPLPLHRVGSTLRHLLREGGRPVLAVKRHTGIPPSRVLAPVDLSPMSADSLRRGLALISGRAGGELPELVALHVIDDRSEGAASRARESLAKFLADHSGDYGGSLRSEIRQGDAVTEILAAARSEKPDLLLMGTHGRSGWQRLRLGSVTESVIRQASTSALVIPPYPAIRSEAAEAVRE